mmetsp:Transcript_75218/g.176485  ORF Transcript_75218/g.176485 Transcript_75218/m.176485 type:complete len:247 (-) Transcript_75218:1117-1857(-)
MIFAGSCMMMMNVMVSPRPSEVTRTTKSRRKAADHCCSLSCSTLPALRCEVVVMMACSTFGRKAMNIFNAAVARTPESRLPIAGWASTNFLTMGTVPWIELSVVHPEMATTMGIQNRNTATRASLPSHFQEDALMSSSAKFSYRTSFESGAINILKACTSRVHCSRDASRCDRMVVKVTKPEEEPTFWSGRGPCAAASMAACSRATRLLRLAMASLCFSSSSSWPPSSVAPCCLTLFMRLERTAAS